MTPEEARRLFSLAYEKYKSSPPENIEVEFPVGCFVEHKDTGYIYQLLRYEPNIWGIQYI